MAENLVVARRFCRPLRQAPIGRPLVNGTHFSRGPVAESVWLIGLLFSRRPVYRVSPGETESGSAAEQPDKG
jgi:hypothetical protein